MLLLGSDLIIAYGEYNIHLNTCHLYKYKPQTPKYQRHSYSILATSIVKTKSNDACVLMNYRGLLSSINASALIKRRDQLAYRN